MLAFINAGHKIGLDSGAVNNDGTQEAQITLECADMVKDYLKSAGVESIVLQSNSLNGEDEDADNPSVCRTANESGADIFISIHCNAFNGVAKGTETCVYSSASEGATLGQYIQNQIVEALGTVDRGLKERSDLCVLRNTDMPACLVELAFIDNDDDCKLLKEKLDDFARAIARGVTDYEAGSQEGYVSKYFSREETECHCGCGGNIVNPILLEKLDALRELIGGPLEISCAYRCPTHNAEVGGVPNSQHTLGNATDVQTPDFEHCNTPEQLAWYCEQIGFDGIGVYDWGCHVDVRDNGESPNEYRWDER